MNDFLLLNLNELVIKIKGNNCVIILGCINECDKNKCNIFLHIGLHLCLKHSIYMLSNTILKKTVLNFQYIYYEYLLLKINHDR